MFRLVLSSLILLPSPSAVMAQGEARYDISYYWDHDPAKARAHRDAVAAALGPGVDARLKVVQSEAGWAVVYRREGDSDGARLVAETHSKLLMARGLGAAAPVRSRSWAEAGADGGAAVPDAAAVERVAKVQEGERRALEALLEERVRDLRKRGRLAPDERTAWTVYDFTTGEELVSINEDLKLQAASLIKPFVALAFLHEVKSGRKAYEAGDLRRLERMIQHSDNAATNAVMRELGGPAAVAKLLRTAYPGLAPDLDLVEYIPPGGRTYRNRASARDYSRYLLAMWRGELPYSEELKRLMALPKRDRLYTGARDVPGDTGVLSKTGSTRHLCGDMGVMLARTEDGREYPYAVVGLIEKKAPARHYLSWLHSRGDVIREISGLVYKGIGERHGFSRTQLAAR
ncbi:serine hydrolase [bacterium]|nr:MAG: serine hydrolase [bacterium]